LREEIEASIRVEKNLPAPEGIDLSSVPKRARSRRIVLWRTTFPQGIFTPQHSTSLTFGRSQGIWDSEANSEASWNMRLR
jgi:hypothetical protein